VLEERRLLATFTVNSLGSEPDGDLTDGRCDTGNAQKGFTGLCTLTAALQNSNLTPGPNTILFQVSGTINVSPTTELGALTSPVILDGKGQIHLEGNQNEYPAFWLLKGSAGSTIKGLAITGFTWGILATTDNNDFENNVIGTDFQGTAGPGNGIGLEVSGGAGKVIRNNVISGNGGDGMRIRDGASGNQITDNFIGAKGGGTEPLGNGNIGMVLWGATNNTIARNVIAANKGGGIELSDLGGSVDGNQILDNAIGTDQTRTLAMGNGGQGLSVGNASDTTIRGNTISANGGGGLDLAVSYGSSAPVTKNLVQGNFIGTDGAGKTSTDATGASLGNKFAGMTLFGGSGNTIGGVTDPDRNVISGNEQWGIEIYTGATGDVIEGNRIGTDVTGTKPLGNGYAGVRLVTGVNNTIGGTVPGAANVISGNNVGIDISGYQATVSTGNLIQGNFIGTDVTGKLAVPNQNGIRIADGASQNTVGGTAAGAGNVISGNQSAGIEINGSGTRNNLIQGNWIGTQQDGSSKLGNGGDGVFIADASNNVIGGTDAGASNTIAFNGGNGVTVQSGTGNAFRHDLTFENQGLGIALVGPNNIQGVIPNHAGAATGPNNRQNYTVLQSVVSQNGTTTIQGALNAVANTAFDLDFYANTNTGPSGFTQGEKFLGSQAVTTDATGNATFTATFPTPDTVTPASPDGYITATATDSDGNTSEFSPLRDVLRGAIAVPRVSQARTKIEADFEPALGLDQVAAIWGVTHFNWVQHVVHLPRDWTAQVGEADWVVGADGKDKPMNISILQDKVENFLDPIVRPSLQPERTYFFQTRNGRTWWRQVWADDADYYWNEKDTGTVSQYTWQDFVSQDGKTFSFKDQPWQPSYALDPKDPDSYIGFKTELVGVKADGTSVTFPDGVGVKFS
jgi:parallel beta-helix repeat protein